MPKLAHHHQRPDPGVPGDGAGTRADPVNLVLNPRGAVGYGSDTLLAYVEGYGFNGPTTVPFEVFDEQEKPIYHDSLKFRGGREVESQVIRLAPDSVSLGELRLVIGGGSGEKSTSALVSFTQAWVVTNFDEMLDLLRYFGQDDRIAALRRAAVGARPALARVLRRHRSQHGDAGERGAQQYFSRITGANQRFKDEGMPGWRTDRGEVFITLGPPDESIENTAAPATGSCAGATRTYRLDLYFLDETGFGRLRLTAGSRAEYERTLIRFDGSKPASAMPPRLFLIDGYALIYRAFFAMISRPLRTTKGENTSAAWGVVNFLLRLREKYRPDYLAWINDAGDLVPRGAVPRLQVHPGEAGRGAPGRLRPRGRADRTAARRASACRCVDRAGLRGRRRDRHPRHARAPSAACRR